MKYSQKYNHVFDCEENIYNKFYLNRTLYVHRNVRLWIIVEAVISGGKRQYCCDCTILLDRQQCNEIKPKNNRL